MQDKQLLKQPHSHAQAYPVIVFRYDDFRSSDDPTFQVERELLELFATYQLPLVVAVIPDCLDANPKKIECLKRYLDAGVVEVALHGWDHQPWNSLYASPGNKSEFRGMPYEQQAERISRGKRLLESWFERPITCFVPPWNSYDANTLKVCSAVGLSIISANVYGAYSSDDQCPILLPTTVALPSLENLVQAWERQAKSGRVAVVCFHAFEFYESGDNRAVISLGEFERLLERVTQAPKVVTLTLSETVQRLRPELTHQRYATAQRVFELAMKIYNNRLRTRLGNYLRALVNLDATGYETYHFYAMQLFKQRVIYYLPPILLVLSIVFLLVTFFVLQKMFMV